MSQMINVIPMKEVMSPSDIEILKNSKFKGFTDAEISYCAKVSNQLQLSPFLNQLHFVRRKNKDGTASIAAQVGIDGFRLAANRTGFYAGADDIAFEIAGPTAKKPMKATATVYKIVGGVRCAFTASARWEEFYNPIGGLWDKLPFQMLGKCAEAQALRKAFPAELAGVYSNEEMDQADVLSKAKAVETKVAESEASTQDEADDSAIVLPKKERITACNCGSELRLSKAGTTYFCPNFKEVGEHVRPIPKAEFESQ
jgi:phage recombination protein Bet